MGSPTAEAARREMEKTARVREKIAMEREAGRREIEREIERDPVAYLQRASAKGIERAREQAAAARAEITKEEWFPHGYDPLWPNAPVAPADKSAEQQQAKNLGIFSGKLERGAAPADVYPPEHTQKQAQMNAQMSQAMKAQAVQSDGGSTSYYELPSGAAELTDLIEHKQMSFARGNCFKALYRLGEKDGATTLYDLNKIEFFVARMKGMLEKGQKP